MANHKSAKKSHTNSLKNAARNKSVKSRVKTFVKKVESSVLKQNHSDAMASLRIMESEIMTAVSKGVLKLNAASRKVSRLNKKIKALVVTESSQAV